MTFICLQQAREIFEIGDVKDMQAQGYVCGCSLTYTYLIHFPISYLFLPKNTRDSSFICVIALLTCHFIMCLAVLELDKAVSVTTAWFRCQDNPTPMCWLYCLMRLVSFQSPWYGCVPPLKDDPSGTVPQRPPPHILMRVALSVTLLFCTQSQLAVRKSAVASVCFLSIPLLLHSFKHTHTHTLPYTPPHTYLFIIFMHTYTYSEDSPQDA